MRYQTTSTILMVRPAHFAFNEETAANNAFQSKDGNLTPAAIKKKAQEEFDEFVKRLRAAGVNVIVANDSLAPIKPDAVFPNNWVSFHQEGYIVTYPMFAPVRRRERRRKVLEAVTDAGFVYEKRMQFEKEEKKGIFLEGTGSIVFDHKNRLAYACRSPRTNSELLTKLCRLMQYRPIVFDAADAQGMAIYHTNVLMAMGDTFVVVCLDAVKNVSERIILEQLYKETKKMIIAITLDQMNAFAGNMLQVRSSGTGGDTWLVMSERAHKSLTQYQIHQLEQHTKLLHSPLYTIEGYGGGSARCMMAEVFPSV